MKKPVIIIVGLLAVAAVALVTVFVIRMNAPAPPVTQPSAPPLSSAVSLPPATTEGRFLAVITSTLGRVEVLAAGGNWSVAATGTTLEKGDTLRTGESAIATITFFDGSTIELEFATEVKILDLIEQAGGNKTISLSQQIGKTTSRVTQLLDPSSRYEVQTPAAVAAVRGSVMFVSVSDKGQTLVGNFEGDIRAAAAGLDVIIPPGMHCIIRPGETPGAPRAGANPVIYSTQIMVDNTGDLFDRDGKPVSGADYLDIMRAQASFSVVSLTEGEFTLRMELKGNPPAPGGSPAEFIEWDFLADIDRNPATGLRWPLIGNDIGYDYLIQLGFQNGLYQARLLNIETNSWQDIEFSIRENAIEIYLDLSEIISSVGGLILGPGDLHWMVAARLYRSGDAPDQPFTSDKAPNQGHYSLLS